MRANLDGTCDWALHIDCERRFDQALDRKRAGHARSMAGVRQIFHPAILPTRSAHPPLPWRGPRSGVTRLKHERERGQAMTVTLVTGSSGFVGQAIVHRLAAQGVRAVGLDPVPSATTHAIDDLSDRASLRGLIAREGVTHIIHAGGVSGPMVMADDPAGIIAVNVTGSLNLLNEALAGGVRTFVYCSSVAAFGNFYGAEPIGEDYPMRPASTYGCSKAAMDYVLRGLWRKVPLDLCSLRLTAVYGPGRRTEFTVDTIVRAARAGAPARLDPLTDWPYVYVDDAADAAIAACFSDRRTQLAYFVAHPERVTPDDIAAACAAAGKPVRLEIDTAKPVAARGPVDVEAAARDFGFSARVGHREGIRRMIEAGGS
jgi:nucleoside-diphosphate-sugar epimerase